MMICAKKNVFKFLLILLFGLLPTNSYGQFQIEEDENEIKWERFESVTNIFTTKFPQKYKYKLYPFRFNENTVAFSAEILSSLDGREITEDKSILIKAVQTFGPQLTGREIDKFLDREATKYAQSVKAIGGTVLNNDDIVFNNFPGKNIYITYRHKGIKYGIRIKIFITDYSMVEQVLTGPADTMYSYRSDDFFESLKLYDGITTLDEPLEFAKGWDDISSKNNIFTVKVPPRNSEYTPVPISFKSSAKKDSVYSEFYDPVRDESFFYSVYSYKTGSTATYENAKSIMFANHITKFVKNASIDSLKTENTIVDGVNMMSIKLIITPPKKYPYINTVFLEVRYTGDTVVVQEILSSSEHTHSGLPNLLLATLKFHPEKYNYKPKKKSGKSTKAQEEE